MSDKDAEASGKGARISLHVKPGLHGSAEAGRDLGLVPSAVRLKQILVPVDFSDHSEKALKYGGKFAEQFGSTLTLLHVIQPVVYPADFGYPPTVLESMDEAVRRQIEERLQGLAANLGHNARTLLRTGQPYFEIAAAARELEVDLIIIATHGHTGLKHVLLGSTAERVVRHAPCPVLTVRDREHDFV
jgi:nucleotide-binding universal stress UspA family protein